MDSKRKIILICGLSFLNIIVWSIIYDCGKPHSLEVTFFDVGQGDAIFIETPEGHQILIDGGPDSTILEKLAQEISFWDQTIDLIILTHAESDHLSGLIEVLKRYKVENIIWTGAEKDSTYLKEWKRLIEEEGANIKIAKQGQRIITQSCLINILYPFENLSGQEFKNLNDSSIVARLVFNQKSFLFSGDIYKSIENKLIENKIFLDSDVLKISHHGSKTSSSADFLEKVTPEIAVISVGKDNSYGHPHQEVLETLNKYAIKVLRTDQSEDIKIISDGKSLQLKEK